MYDHYNYFDTMHLPHWWNPCCVCAWVSLCVCMLMIHLWRNGTITWCTLKLICIHSISNGAKATVQSHICCISRISCCITYIDLHICYSQHFAISFLLHLIRSDIFSYSLLYLSGTFNAVIVSYKMFVSFVFPPSFCPIHPTNYLHLLQTIISVVPKPLIALSLSLYPFLCLLFPSLFLLFPSLLTLPMPPPRPHLLKHS